MDTKSEYWKGDQIFNVPQRHVCWRLVLHVSQIWEVMGPFKEGWKLEVFRSLEFLHLGQLQDPQSCPFPTWHEVKDFCLPVGSFLEVCSLTTPQVQDNGTSQSWTRTSKSVSQKHTFTDGASQVWCIATQKVSGNSMKLILKGFLSVYLSEGLVR